MIEINRNPTARDLRWFGALLPVFFAVAGTLAYYRWEAPRTAQAIWAFGLLFFLTFLLVARWRRALYLGWLTVVYPIGWVVSHLLLALIYYLVLTPIGLLLRLTGHDPMERKLDRSSTSYWRDRSPPPENPESYYRQF